MNDYLVRVEIHGPEDLILYYDEPDEEHEGAKDQAIVRLAISDKDPTKAGEFAMVILTTQYPEITEIKVVSVEPLVEPAPGSHFVPWQHDFRDPGMLMLHAKRVKSKQ